MPITIFLQLFMTSSRKVMGNMQTVHLQMNDNYKGTASAVLFLLMHLCLYIYIYLSIYVYVPIYLSMYLSIFMYLLCKKCIFKYPRGV